MFNDLINRCNSVIDGVTRPFKDAGSAIKTGFDTVGRKFENLTSYLPEGARNIAKDTYWSSPYALTLCAFIAPGLGILAAGTAVVAVKMFEKNLGPQTAKEYYTAIRTFCAVGAAVDVARASMTLNPVLLFSVPFYILFGMMAHQHAQDVAARAGI